MYLFRWDFNYKKVQENLECKVTLFGHNLFMYLLLKSNTRSFSPISLPIIISLVPPKRLSTVNSTLDFLVRCQCTSVPQSQCTFRLPIHVSGTPTLPELQHLFVLLSPPHYALLLSVSPSIPVSFFKTKNKVRVSYEIFRFVTENFR